jgi:hypothetical protein
MQDYKRLHSKELQHLYPSSDVISTVKLKSMRRAGHMARRGEEVKCIQGLVEKT